MKRDLPFALSLVRPSLCSVRPTKLRPQWRRAEMSAWGKGRERWSFRISRSPSLLVLWGHLSRLVMPCERGNQGENNQGENPLPKSASTPNLPHRRHQVARRPALSMGVDGVQVGGDASSSPSPSAFWLTIEELKDRLALFCSPLPQAVFQTPRKSQSFKKNRFFA